MISIPKPLRLRVPRQLPWTLRVADNGLPNGSQLHALLAEPRGLHEY